MPEWRSSVLLTSSPSHHHSRIEMRPVCIRSLAMHRAVMSHGHATVQKMSPARGYLSGSGGGWMAGSFQVICTRVAETQEIPGGHRVTQYGSNRMRAEARSAGLNPVWVQS